MGLGNKNSAVFIGIADGKVVRRFKEATKNTVERVLTKGVNAGKTVYEEFYDYIEGHIIDIAVKKTDKMGKFWKITLLDEGTEYVLEMNYSSGYSSAFLKTLPNVDFTKPVRITPKMTLENGKKRATLFVNQNGTGLKWYFTKDNPNGLPQMVKTKHKGEEVWDDTEMLDFLEREVVNGFAMPRIRAARGAASNVPSETQKEVDKLTQEELERIESETEDDVTIEGKPLADGDCPF